MTQPAKPADVSVDPSAGKKLQTMLAAEMQQVESWLAKAGELSQRAPLGRNPVGEAMAAKFADRAGDGGSALAGVLKPYKQVLQQAHDAVVAAMDMYQSTEHHAVSSLKAAAGTEV
ncbi:hypothetical protein [Amycolatopsis taiwanensis]|uniref:PE domain-containing protein n=1 Tax=Amycolatopsis taiwanensis TaxID=342230 RepID=A0A9W6R3D2_9PSEU|nr:hypothetical protein [Amycolatopsis taiwanensis]GLY66745.1 hypothetical protein Atai01_33640 [Amycolatopsis taiwanensis]